MRTMGILKFQQKFQFCYSVWSIRHFILWIQTRFVELYGLIGLFKIIKFLVILMKYKPNLVTIVTNCRRYIIFEFLNTGLSVTTHHMHAQTLTIAAAINVDKRIEEYNHTRVSAIQFSSSFPLHTLLFDN